MPSGCSKSPTVLLTPNKLWTPEERQVRPHQSRLSRRSGQLVVVFPVAVVLAVVMVVEIVVAVVVDLAVVGTVVVLVLAFAVFSSWSCCRGRRWSSSTPPIVGFAVCPAISKMFFLRAIVRTLCITAGFPTSMCSLSLRWLTTTSEAYSLIITCCSIILWTSPVHLFAKLSYTRILDYASLLAIHAITWFSN